MSKTPLQNRRAFIQGCLASAALLTVGVLPLQAVAQDKSKAPTVAVLYFDYNGNNEDLTVLRKGLAQMLIVDLAPMEHIRLVERDRLEEVLAELELARTAKIDKRSAARIGKLLGARYMVMGHYMDMKDNLYVSARVVDVQTGQILEATQANGKSDDFFQLKDTLATSLQTILTKALPKTIEPAPRKRPANKPKPAKKAQKADAKPAKKAKVSQSAAVHYSKALDAQDRGDKDAAKANLQAAVAAEPDFDLAADDLAAMMQ